jgi:F-type H+-transporting ATPase subunit a
VSGVLALHFPSVRGLFDWPGLALPGTPFEINKTVLLLWITVAIVAGVFLTAARRRQLVPTGIRNVVEAALEFVERDIAREGMGPDGDRWVPFLTTVFCYVLVLNLWGIVPLVQFPPTSRIAIPLYLALQTWVLFIAVGIKTQGPVQYFKHALFPPGVPKPLYVLVAPIEFLSVFVVQPFSLAIRLFANMMAGHLLLVAFFVISAALWTRSAAVVILPLPVAAAVALTAFELLVGVLQAYIFTILTAVYIGQSVHPEAVEDIG